MPGKLTTEYRIKDVNGALVAVHEHVRNTKTGEKQCYWKRPNGEAGLNGTKLVDLPLYGVHELDEDATLVIVVEGEKTRDALADALADAPVSVVGTVTGASSTPSLEALEALRGHEVALWPDHDAQGVTHMAQVGERLQGVAALVRWYHWHDAPDKGGDAADHPAVKSADAKGLDRLLNDLCGAPEYVAPEPEPSEPARGLRGRVKLGERIQKGVEPPELLTPRLYAGKVHAINSEPGEGKTLYALFEALQVMDQGLPVLYLDAENGPGTMTERLEDMGADPERLDNLFHYHPTPDITLEADALADLAATVEEVDPGLVVFDSLPDFLALCGLSENDAGDVTRFMVKVVQPIRNRGGAVMILDHVTKSAEGRGRYARGSGAKLAKVDVSWALTQNVPFDRERVGEIRLTLRKDREAYLQTRHTFAVGGSGGRLLFRPADGVIEESGADGLTDSARVALDALNTLHKQTGAGVKFGAWLESTGLPKTTFRRAIGLLCEGTFCEKREQRYYPKPPVKGPHPSGPKNSPNSGATGDGPKTGHNPQNPRKSKGPHDEWPQSGPNGPSAKGPQGPPPYRGGPNGPNAGERLEDAYDRLVSERMAELGERL